MSNSRPLTIMGPDANVVASRTALSDKIPPAFDGFSSYGASREDLELWISIITLETRKQGPMVIARLLGEAKSTAKSHGNTVITSAKGVISTVEKLNSIYKTYQTDQLDIDLASFFNYCWTSDMYIEHFIAGFNTRLDKISELDLNDKLKEHILLRQARLDQNSKNLIIESSSKKYNFQSISTALRSVLRNLAMTSMTQIIILSHLKDSKEIYLGAIDSQDDGEVYIENGEPYGRSLYQET